MLSFVCELMLFRYNSETSDQLK